MMIYHSKNPPLFDRINRSKLCTVYNLFTTYLPMFKNEALNQDNDGGNINV